MKDKIVEIFAKEVDRIETDLLDAINSGLRKWEYKKKLSTEDALELLFCLQDRIMNVKLTHPTVSEEEIDIEATFLINSNWNVSSGCKVMTYKDFKAAIKELLNR